MAQDNASNIKRGFKITDVFRKRLVGVACSSLSELKTKGCNKLQIKRDIKHIDVCLSDSTIIDDEAYFKSLPSQTLLILRQPGEKIVQGVDIIYRALKSFNIELLRAASQVREFLDQDAQDKIKILSQFVKDQEESQKAMFSKKSDDPDWFEDLDTLADTKEEFMRKRSRGRIQRYFYTTKETIKNSPLYCTDINAKKYLDNSFNEFYQRLKRDDFFSCYFDRTDVPKSLCDNNGVFLCQGLWNNDNCSYVSGQDPTDHKINPYVSKECRVIFSMWNLDHRVERSRRVIPALLHASEICCSNRKPYRINSDYFYELLFTTKNLKLVHIVCHDKNEHKSAICDRKLYVIEDSVVKAANKRYRPLRNTLSNGIRYKRIKGNAS